ncbi:Peptidase S8/S53 domain-containing protein [Artemisia annua]|uniref:Peptidase S8/S53 domain-containing protein n=1 Tax=Artemisia annua TaxID=35608 RepID=A0A2U1K9N3_ARTAN|nr:Peptidase S8/S53 domain-containing protein [Artemisia annua]
MIRDQTNGSIATPLDFGAGHVDPNQAMDPGLIYDMDSQDYIDFLCGLGYTTKQMMTVIRKSQWTCDENRTDLNYPSFITSLSNQTTSYPIKKKFTRTVTNVGDPTSIYRAVIQAPEGMIVSVEPNIMRFTGKYQKQNFVLNVHVEKPDPKPTYGYLNWIDEHNHIVSSPIVIISHL